MSETKGLQRAGAYGSYGEYFNALRTLANGYADLPASSFYTAWAAALQATNPYIQNQRVKRISTVPGDYSKSQIVDMLKAPDNRERDLRSVGMGLEWTAYPYRKIRMTYQGVNTYRYYHYPAYLSAEEAKSPTVRREGVLLDKLNRRLRPDAWAHQIVGQAWQMGKVAYVPRISVDKPHNGVNYAFMQQLPADWYRIVGFNSESKYTVMFDMMYFLGVPGASWQQFGSLFEPYLDDFNNVLVPEDNIPGLGKKFVYASKNKVVGQNGRRFCVDFSRLNENAPGNPKLYNQSGRWHYFVTLPVEKVWVFEIDDTSRTAAPMSAGLFPSFSQISDVEDVALSVMQNPLVSLVFGEIPYWNEKNGADSADPTKLSPTGREYFLAEWAQMIAAYNAGGIGFFPAPFANLHMETLPEVTGSSEMTTKQYGYAVLKSGMSGLIPINSDPRAGAVEISAKLEERVALPVYQQFSRMMESLYRGLNLSYEWRFTMFGGFVSDAADLEAARQGMTLGILSETVKYLALRGLSLWEDMGISEYVSASGILDKRIPLVSSYHATQDKSGLPPMPEDKGGRPTKDADQALAEGGEAQEADLDK